MEDMNALYFHSQAYSGLQSGTRLIVLGAVHGNEPCGTRAIERVMQEIRAGSLRLVAGSVTFVPVTNPLAFARQQRVGDRNLNRNLFPTDRPQQFEDHVANWLCPLLARHDALLDLHSFHTGGEPFVMLGPENNNGTLEPFAHAAEEESLARHLGVRRFVDGWLDTYALGVELRAALARSGAKADASHTDLRYGVGTTEYMRSIGGYGLTLECGQHDDPEAPHIAYRAIRNALAHLGISSGSVPVPVADSEALRLYRVVDKHHPDDRLSRDWASFDRVSAGELIGVRHDGTQVLADCDGYLVFPNPNAQPGQEWFYLAKPGERI
ncbi:MAG: succinylglutamate desuccinylase/aspartoacylase family protein [Thiobacillaceae bacterium]|jgi:predicted deacylase|nr:succinylglutamate desuccinylase/aspartoacylase family protein [Thiobacillaceae bacterium]